MNLIAVSAPVFSADGAPVEIQMAATNPYWPMANRSVADVLALPDEKLSGKEAATNAFWLAWGYTAPQSERRREAEVLEKCVRLLDALAHRHESRKEGDKLPSDSSWDHLPLLESLLFLQSVEEIAAARKSRWKEALRPAIGKDFREYGQNSKKNWATAAAKNYPNADAQHAAIMSAAYLVYQDGKFKENAAEFVAAMERHLRPPGAWLYYLGSTPIPLYHGFELIFLGRYYQLSRDPAAADQIRRTKDYYPYTYVPENTVEYSSSPWWKQMWNPVGGPYHAPEIAAWLCGDGRNRWFADLRAKTYFRHYWVAYCGEAWDEAAASGFVHPEPFPDDYLVPDASVDGLRGRFGSFSFVGSRGRNAMGFGGCMLADRNLPSGYDGYLQFARLGIVAPGFENQPYFEAMRLVAEPRDEPVAGGQVIGGGFAALAASYEPRSQLRPEIAADDWRVLERWLFTPGGVVAVFEATALRDDPGSWPEGLIRLGPLLRPHELEGDIFYIGNLHGRILKADGFEVTMAEGGPDQSGSDSRVEVRLKLDSPPPKIGKGQKWSYAVLFSPDKTPTGSVDFDDGGSLLITLGDVGYRLDWDAVLGLRAERNTVRKEN